MRKVIILAAAAAVVLGTSGYARAAADALTPKKIEWPQSGPFGTFDRPALQRGFQVYKEVCAACHSMRLLSFRDLEGIGFSMKEVKAIAGDWTYTIPTTDKEGEPAERQPIPSDRFALPFPNEKAARAANGGAFPPDLSVMIKARPGHEDYVYSLITGYEDPPEGFDVLDGLNYNPYFRGRQIAMPQPLSEDAVEYTDGTPATVEQMASDVTTFLAWASEPTMEARKRLGFKVIIFLIVLTGLLYAVKRKVWAKLH